MNMRFFVPICIFILFLIPLQAQETSTIATNIYRQFAPFPQEKIYLMTDKAAYMAGEYLWFRAFLIDACTHREDVPLSRYVYVDLIDPDGNILKHHQIRPDTNGVFHNRLELDNDMVEGVYLLRAYTAGMRSQPEYFFEKKVFIADPQSLVIAVEPNFTTTGDGNISVSFRFRSLKDSSFISVETIKIKTGKAEPKEFPAKNIISLRVNSEKDKYLNISFTYNNKQYRKYIPIPYPGDATFDVSFFPEGGYLIDGVASKVGFKALRSDGLSEDVTGEIYDSENNHIASFQSLHAGMGFFVVVPESNKTYYALCTNKDSLTIRFELPVIQPNVCVIRLIQKSDGYLIAVDDHRIQKDDLFLLIHIRGRILFADQMPQNNLLMLKDTDFPPGIIQIVLLDKAMNPLSERLIFNRPNNLAQTEINSDYSDYGMRAPVKLLLKLDLPDGYRNSGSFALSVTDNHSILPDSSMTINSYLLLSSELRGSIEDANYYMSNTLAARDALDALMLTQGWRRYHIPLAAKEIIEESDSYVERWQGFSGTVKEVLTGRRIQNASVWVMAPDYNYIQEVKTDKSGQFTINGFEWPDSTRYVIHAHASSNRRVALILNPELPQIPTKPIASRSKEQDYQFRDYTAIPDPKYFVEQGMPSYEIPDAIVTSKKPEEGRSIFSSDIMDVIVPQQVIELYHNSIIDILSASNEVQITRMNSEARFYGYQNTIVRIRPFPLHEGAPLIVLDNVPVPLTVDDLEGIPIKKVEVLRMPSSLIFGQNGRGGALLVTTDFEAEAQIRNQHIAIVTPLGFKKEVEFYAPKYETVAQRYNSNPDLRTTIYWKPDIQISDGEASIEFYTADTKTTYSLVLEGITTDGITIRHTKVINRTK